MSKMFLPRPADPEENRQLDAEFERDLAAGTIPIIDVPPVDPATDPFGRNYSWLKGPTDPFGRAFNAFANLKNADLLLHCGAEVRAIALANSFAGGTDDAVMKNWAIESVPAICIASGPDGEDLLETLKSGPEIGKGLLAEIETVLANHTSFAPLTVEQRVAAALLIVHAFSDPS
jgi:hypothetical protein